MSSIGIRFGGYQGPTSVHNRAVTVFGENLSETLGDDVSFAHTLNVMDLGHPATALLDMVSSGEMTFCYFASSYLGQWVPEFELLDLPFSVRDRAQAHAMLDGPLCSYLAERVAEVADYRVVAWWDNGFRHFSNGVRAIRRPEDCAGLTIRTLKSDIYTRTFSRLGFEPVFTDVKDLAVAVESGQVDAQENALANTFNFGFYKHHRWITLSRHFFGPSVVLCHKAAWDGWSDEVRGAVAAALEAATAAQRSFADAEEGVILEKYDTSNNEVAELTEDERAAFAAAVQPVVEETVARHRDELFEYLPTA
jgi:TRAP-type C4-dicarboxylate transport system substrate-binding protein